MSLGYIPFRLHCDLNIYHFRILPDIPEVPFDMTRVHPLKQREVYKIYELLKASPIVKSAWIFGSSVSYFCHEKSDTDIMIETVFSRDYDCYDLGELSLELSRLCPKSCDLIRKECIGERDVFNLIGLERGVQIK